jgi:hypothetical protein
MTAMKHIFTIALSALLLASCVRVPEAGTAPATGGEAMVRLSIFTPAPYSPTRAADTDYRVDAISVIVLGSPVVGGAYTYQYTAQGSQLATTGQTTTFVANLETTDTPVKLIIVANHDIAPGAITAGAGEDDVRSALTGSFLTQPEVIPMYGEVRLDAGLTASTHNISVQMLRAFARMSVAVALDGDSPSFEPVDYYVYRANDSYRVIPDNSAMTSVLPPDIDAASVPAASTAQTITGFGFPTIYLPESLAVSDPAAQVSEATCIVVGGFWNGAPNMTYYRIDFNAPGQPFGQILRNYDYRFTITHASAPGFTDRDQAANSIAESMVVDIAPWNILESKVFIGNSAGDYIILDRSTVNVAGTAASVGYLEVFSSKPFTFGFTNSTGAGPFVRSDDPAPAPLVGNYTTATVITYENIGSLPVMYTSIITLTANADNATGSTQTEQLYIMSDIDALWDLDVVVDQLPIPQEKINILSAGTSYGSLGSWFGGAVASDVDADEMKTVLATDALFGPAGVVKCGGFTMNAVPTGELTGGELEYYLGLTDIFIMAYGYNPADADCQAILDWLAEPGHVLFLCCDNGSTNVTMRAKLNPTATWNNISLLGTLINILTGTSVNMACLLNSDNAPFINGVFGLADQSGGGVWHDGVAQFMNVVPPNITPLIEFGARTGDGLIIPYSYSRLGGMLMGVDKTRRVIYMGDSQLMSIYFVGGAGAVVGNTWAWAVGQVLAGK